MCIIISVMTIHPRVQESQPSSGLLQAAVISAYSMYLTWSAMSNEPDAKCNPGNVYLYGVKIYCRIQWESYFMTNLVIT